LKTQAQKLYLILAGLFIAALVSCNLIFQKFFSWDAFGFYTFEISAGIIAYPVTFLITDIISEIYGRRKANQVIIAGLFASLFVLGIILIAESVPATDWSPVNDATFSQVFGLTGVAVGASMMAYLLAQFIDVKLFHCWKQLTDGKHLWLRNNGSTFVSQLVDTATVLALLCFAGAIEWDKFGILLLNGFLFKILMALIDTPILYLATSVIRKKFNLQFGEEVKF
jgi:queuosine precursor transporter